MLTQEQIQAIADRSAAGGCDFRLALATASRDGHPWYRCREEQR